jgi:hypothetical protein
MKLQKTVNIQEGYEKELSTHYEAPRDKDKLLTIPRSGMYRYTYKYCDNHVIICPEMFVLPYLQSFCRILFNLGMDSLK